MKNVPSSISQTLEIMISSWEPIGCGSTTRSQLGQRRISLTRCPATCRVPRGHPLLRSVKADEKSPLQIKTAGDVAVVRHIDLAPDYEEPDYGPEGAAVFLSTEEKTNALRVYHFDTPVRAAFLKYRVRIAKTTTATQLAIKDGPKKPLEELIPTKFMKYRKVFNETSAQRLPSVVHGTVTAKIRVLL